MSIVTNQVLGMGTLLTSPAARSNIQKTLPTTKKMMTVFLPPHHHIQELYERTMNRHTEDPITKTTQYYIVDVTNNITLALSYILYVVVILFIWSIKCVWL